MSLTPRRPRGAPLSVDARARAFELTERLGVPRAAAALGVSVNALRGALAGLHVLPGTSALIERGLASPIARGDLVSGIRRDA
jgi:hypothetical protein